MKLVNWPTRNANVEIAKINEFAARAGDFDKAAYCELIISKIVKSNDVNEISIGIESLEKLINNGQLRQQLEKILALESERETDETTSAVS